jgi:small subunit ribosomal protein S8e
MGVYHGRSRRTDTGARQKHFKGKRKRELGRTPTETVIGKPKRLDIDGLGNSRKRPLLRAQEVNVTDPENNTTFRAELEDVEENSANMDYQRRKVITRGTIITTSKGRARVTSRPGQDGIINAVLI